MDCTGADISRRGGFFAFFRPRVPKNEVFPVFDSIIDGKIFQIKHQSNDLLFGVLSIVDDGGNVCVRTLGCGGFIEFIIVGIAGGDETGGADVGGALATVFPLFLSIEKKNKTK